MRKPTEKTYSNLEVWRFLMIFMIESSNLTWGDYVTFVMTTTCHAVEIEIVP